MTDIDDAMAGLVLELAELRGQVEQLSGRQRDSNQALSELRAGLEDLAAAAPPGTGIRAWVWQELDDEAAEAAWTALSDWMRDVLLSRYPAAVAVLHPCWYRHPDVVDALTALYATWSAAYSNNPAATASDAATWLERWLPAAIRQIRDGLASCRRDSHADPAGTPADHAARLLGGDFSTYVAIDLAARVPPADADS